MTHLTTALYQMFLDGTLPARVLARALHQHLLACPQCAAEWEAAKSAKAVAAAEQETKAKPIESVLGDPSSVVVAHSMRATHIETTARRLRRSRKEAQIDLWRLLQLPADRREERIINARTRFRSRAFAELVVEHGRKLVRSAPHEAAGILELASTAMMWTPGWPDTPWMQALEVRAEAHRANALRVAGDLLAAEELFGQVRRKLAKVPLAEAAVYAEVASLEASLRWDQDRLDDAVRLVDQAVLIYQDAGDREGLARVLIKRSSIAQESNRPGDSLRDLERARELLDPAAQTSLYLFTVVGIVPILLDEERYEEAAQVLINSQETFEAASEPWWALRLRHLLGRARLGLGQLDKAEELLHSAREGFVEQKLPYEAASLSLDVALLYLRQGRASEVRRLVNQAAPIFRSLGIESGGLAGLLLLQKAAAAEALTVVRDLRQQLRAAEKQRTRQQKPR